MTHICDAKPSSEPMLPYYQLDPEEHISVIFFNSQVFIEENALENVVCKMMAILSRSQCIKTCALAPLLHCIFHSTLSMLNT